MSDDVLTVESIRRAIRALRYQRSFDRCPPHVVGPGLELVSNEAVEGARWVGCANLCGATFLMRRRPDPGPQS